MIGLTHKQGSREWVDNTSGTALSLCSLEFLSKKASSLERHVGRDVDIYGDGMHLVQETLKVRGF